MIKINSLNYNVAGYSLLNHLNGSFSTNTKYGLVGPNGIGKSTLALLICGSLKPDLGKVITTAHVAYLQQIEDKPDCILSDYVSCVWDCTTDYLQLIVELIHGIYLNQLASTLSGGEWIRIRIAKALSQGFDFLILDEPTNNMDQNGRKIIYKFIQQYHDGLIVISHDRELLNEMDQIAELSNQGLSFYGGNYSFYHEQKNHERIKKQNELAKLQLESKKNKKEQEIKILRQEKRMRTGAQGAADSGLPRIIIGGRKRQAQVSMGKVVRQVDNISNEINQKIIDATKDIKTDPFIRLDFESSKTPKGKTILFLEDLNWKFKDQAHYLWQKNLNLVLKGQDKLNIQGKNGSGKSTLIKIILQNQNLLGQLVGLYKLNTKAIAYLDQNYEILNKDNTVFDNVFEESRFSQTELRNELAFFGFTSDKVFQKVLSLSGGELLKASLAKIFLGRSIPELIILDEPTNNLDLQGIELLESALSKFKGTLIIISHDKNFVEKLNPNCTIVLSNQTDLEEV